MIVRFKNISKNCKIYKYNDPEIVETATFLTLIFLQYLWRNK